GGAVKNVFAIGCGIVEGRGLGDNARAALITRGLAEIVRLGLAKGARAETLMGLSGIGDLTLTCNATQSRNFSLGVALGRGEALADVLAERTSVAEGVFTAAAVTALADRIGVETPICLAVDGILNHFADIDATIEGLLARPQGVEETT
ncbi:MAG: NAD(P)H-dependent glycerol-3-phosphate dehydrogenase, partial [Rhodospirillales bacterium]